MSRLRTVLLALAVFSPFVTACKKEAPAEEAPPAEAAEAEEGAGEAEAAPEPLNAATVDRYIAFEKELNEQGAEHRKAMLQGGDMKASTAFAQLQDSLREKHRLSDSYISALRLTGSQLLIAKAGPANAAQEKAIQQMREQMGALPPDQRAGMEASIKQLEAQMSGEGALASLRQQHGDAAAEAVKARRDDLLAVTRTRIEQETGKPVGQQQ